MSCQIDYPAACNAVETLLIHQSLLETVWPDVAHSLLTANVKLLCDGPALSALTSFPTKNPANHPNFPTHVLPSPPEAYTTEYLSLTLAVRTVPSLVAAIAHINEHGSHHTDSIFRKSTLAGSTFVRGVGSAGVFVNASTRFADGFRYGFGAEVGISTGQIHARGPVGLEGLVTYKYEEPARRDISLGNSVGNLGRNKRTPTHRGEGAPF